MEDFFREEKIYIYTHTRVCIYKSVNKELGSVTARARAFDLFAGSFRFSFITGYPAYPFITHGRFSEAVWKDGWYSGPRNNTVRRRRGAAKNRHSESPPFYSLAFNPAGVGAKKSSLETKGTDNERRCPAPPHARTQGSA